MVLEAVRNNGIALEYASDTLRADQEVVLEAMVKFVGSDSPLQFANIKFTSDPGKMLEALKIDVETIEYADKGLFNDHNFILNAIKIDETCLEYADEKLWGDREFVVEAMKLDPYNLEFASEELKNDPELKKILEG